MQYIIAPIYEFLNHNAALYGIAEPASLVNDGRSSLHPPLISVSAYAHVADKRVKGNQCFRPQEL